MTALAQVPQSQPRLRFFEIRRELPLEGQQAAGVNDAERVPVAHPAVDRLQALPGPGTVGDQLESRGAVAGDRDPVLGYLLESMGILVEELLQHAAGEALLVFGKRRPALEVGGGEHLPGLDLARRLGQSGEERRLPIGVCGEEPGVRGQ